MCCCRLFQLNRWYLKARNVNQKLKDREVFRHLSKHLVVKCAQMLRADLQGSFRERAREYLDHLPVMVVQLRFLMAHFLNKLSMQME